MKKRIALLVAMTFLLSGMAAFAEKAQTENAVAQTEATENAGVEMLEWTVPFEDGEWMNIPEWNAELYLPVGWQLFEVVENGFVVTDPQQLSTVTVLMEEFIAVEADQAAAEERDEAETEEAEAAEETSAFAAYLSGLGQEYELTQAGEREMGILKGESSVTIRFVMNDKLVIMDFAPVEEGGISDHALKIAETFYMYEVDENAEVPAQTEEETAE